VKFQIVYQEGIPEVIVPLKTSELELLLERVNAMPHTAGVAWGELVVDPLVRKLEQAFDAGTEELAK
jgi:hypothetical protein